MKRHLIAAFVLASLLLSATAVAMWVRSHRAEDFVGYGRRGIGTWAAWSRVGRLSLWSDRYEEAKAFGPNAPPVPGGWRFTTGRLVKTGAVVKPGRWPDGNRGSLGFVYETDRTGRHPYTAVAVPWWAVAVVPATSAALCTAVWVRARRRRNAVACTSVTCGRYGGT